MPTVASDIFWLEASGIWQSRVTYKPESFYIQGEWNKQKLATKELEHKTRST